MGEAETGGVGAPACPVCREPLPARPERCFRCEASLGTWWEIDRLLGEEERGTEGAGGTRPGRPAGAVASPAPAPDHARQGGSGPPSAVGAGPSILVPSRRVPTPSVFKRRGVLVAAALVLATAWGAGGFAAGWVTGVAMFAVVAEDTTTATAQGEGRGHAQGGSRGGQESPRDHTRTGAAEPRGTHGSGTWIMLTYVVQRGDSPWRIATTLTGEGRNWLWMWALNGLSERIRPGDRLEFEYYELPEGCAPPPAPTRD